MPLPKDYRCRLNLSDGSVTDLETGEVFTRVPDSEDRHVTGGRSGLLQWRSSIMRERKEMLNDSRDNLEIDNQLQALEPRPTEVSESDLRHPLKKKGWPEDQ